MSFLDVQFPEELTPYFNKTLQSSTSIGKMQNGKEFRRSLKKNVVVFYELFRSIKQVEKISILEDFFHIVHGQMYSFKIFDAIDYKIENIPCKYLNSNTVQIQKIYQFQGMSYAKDITKPKHDTVVIYKDGAILISGYTVNYELGIVTFDEDISESVITVTCEYFHHVRFMSDSIRFTMKGNASFEINNITMVEVLD